MGIADRSYANSERSFRARTASAWPTPMVWAVLIALGGAWVVQQFDPGMRVFGALILRLDDGLALREAWRWATFPLAHYADVHVFMAGLSVYLFMSQLEREWGWVRALACFVLGNLCAAGAYAAIVALGGVESIGFYGGFYGAIGGALAVLSAAAYRLPRDNVFDYVPNRLMATLVGVIWVLFILGPGRVTDIAHLAGIPFGIGMAMWSMRRPRMRLAAEPPPRTIRAARDDARAGEARMSLDDVLAKVSREGIGSLSKEERETLEIATRRRRAE